MKREVSLSEISDGKLYSINDMVKADCNGCKGCSACCRGMGDSIVLDPLDISRLTANLHCTFEALLADRIELHVIDSVILPSLKMTGAQEACSFLNEQGRCSIHSFRPGICRLFPLGRYYENDSFWYFLQVHECKNKAKTKIKVHKWIDTPDVKQYEAFISKWHYFLKDAESVICRETELAYSKQINLYLLKQFYMQAYNPAEDFYQQFESRLTEAKQWLKQIKGER